MAQSGFASFRWNWLVIALVFLLGGEAAGQNSVDDFRSKLAKWVETRQILSEEQTDWELDKEALEATRDLLRQERQDLREEIERLERTSTAADDERRALLLARGDFQRASRTLAEQIAGMEMSLLELTDALPAPLLKKLEPLLVQIPSEPAASDAPLGQRLLNVLGVLVQVEKFNGTATFVGETRPAEGGREVQVRTLYWGLAQAVFAASVGDTAGIGRPTADGWSFENQTDLAERARFLLDIYEGNVDVIEFVSLPATVEAW